MRLIAVIVKWNASASILRTKSGNELNCFYSVLTCTTSKTFKMSQDILSARRETQCTVVVWTLASASASVKQGNLSHLKVSTEHF